MRDEIRQALEVDGSTPMEERTIDITTTGRRSGEPRRIETVFSRVQGDIYLTGIPMPRPRAWLRNLSADPRFTFHLKRGVVADLAAEATVITDAGERRRILAELVTQFNERQGPDSPWPRAELDEWVANSPLVRVTFRAAED